MSADSPGIVCALPRLRGVAFDLDGTLIDSFADLAFAVNEVRKAYGLAPLAQAGVSCHVGAGTAELVRNTVPVPAEEAARAHERFLAIYDRNLLRETRPYPGVERVLDALSHLVLGLISNKPVRQSEAILRGLGWERRFAVVLGGDSLPAKKPDPLPVLEYLRRTGVPADSALLVGDSPLDIRAGRAAGVLTAGVTYGNSAREALEAEKPDFMFDSLNELLELPR